MKRAVTFHSFGEKFASSRLRAIIPQRELMALGFPRGSDVLVVGKHGWPWDEMTRGYKRVVFDVCDDHFDGKHGAHYLEACSRADAVTCNSYEMQRLIKAVTGRDAWMIPDPWEAPEGKPRVGDNLLWYGHASNLRDLGPWMDRLVGRKLTIISGIDAESGGAHYVKWSPEAMTREFERAGLVLIPTGKSMCKSGNRAIEAIRRGVFPICGPLPAYADLGVWVGDIGDGIDWALSHHDEVIRRIRSAQDYVRWQFNPALIAKQWIEVLGYV